MINLKQRGLSRGIRLAMSLLLLAGIFGAAVQEERLYAQPGQVRIWGYVYFWNGAIWQPVRWASVDLLDENSEWYGDALLETVSTDGDGYFSSSWRDNVDTEGNGTALDIYLLVQANNAHCSVSQWPSGLYSERSDTWYEISDGAQYSPFYLPAASNGAWLIFDTLYTGWNYFNGLGYQNPKVTAYWPSSLGPSCIDGNIYLRGDADGDDKDPDVILHEYGHAIMGNVYGYWPCHPLIDLSDPPIDPNACWQKYHSWNSQRTPTFAWFEGWAYFAEGMVQNEADYEDWRYPPGSVPVCDVCYYFEANLLGDDIEGAIGGLMWDLLDGVDPGDGDDIQVTSGTVWAAFTRTSPGVWGDYVDDIYEYRGNLMLEGQSCLGLQTIFNTHGLNTVCYQTYLPLIMNETQ